MKSKENEDLMKIVKKQTLDIEKSNGGVLLKEKEKLQHMVEQLQKDLD